jgi:hypothetical protein
MNVAEDALQPALPQPVLPQPAPLAEVPRTAAAYRLTVYLACSLVFLAVNYALGEDLRWDTLNYHVYAGFSAVHDRFVQDYFAAGPQSYFNPYVYAPFYALISSGLSALAVSSVLAAAQSSILWLTYELALCVCPSDDRRSLLVTGLCAVALAFLNPILIEQVGSSFADITTAALVVCGWLLLARAVQAPRVGLIVGAGLILGTATALKMTNAVHALAASALLLLLPRPFMGKLRCGLGYAGALGLGFAIVAGPWAFRLAQRFGNPLFPLLNNVFRSPEFTTEPLRHYRFIPGSLSEALWRPFAIADPALMVDVEPIAPDVRYALLLVVCGAVALRWLWRHRERRSLPAPAAASTRVLLALGCALAVDWALWLTASGNGRYFLPMAAVTAVVIVGLLARELGARTRAFGYILAATLGIQTVQLWMSGDYRETSKPWGGPWLRVAMPERLTTEPNLYLTIGVQTNSFLAPYLAKGAGLVNLSGAYALGSVGGNGAQIQALVRRYAPHVRVLIAGQRLYADAERREPLRSEVDDVLERVGLRVDESDCATITVYGVPPPLEIRFGTTAVSEQQPDDTSQLVTCHTVAADSTGLPARQLRQRAVDLVFDRLEDACPQVFQPRRLLTEHFGGRWQRYYGNTDVIAWVSRGDVKFRQLLRGDDVVNLGRESAWEKKPLTLACGERDRHYFARVLEPKEGP